MSYSETRQGFDVRLVIHAHVMADTFDEAVAVAVEGLRRQTRVQLTTITPVGEVPEVEDTPDVDVKADVDVTGVYTPTAVLEPVHTPEPKPRRTRRKGAHRPLVCENHALMPDWDEGCTPGFVGCAHAQQETQE